MQHICPCAFVMGLLLISGSAMGQASGTDTKPAAASTGMGQSQASGGHTKPASAATGMGQTQPAADISADANWSVNAFERDGIRYLQVNSLDGVVHAAVGFIEDTIWTLPIGTDADRVSTPQNPLAIPATVTRTVVYRSPEIELAAYATDHGVIWAARKP